MSAEADAVASMLQLATNTTDSQEQTVVQPAERTIHEGAEEDGELDHPSDSSLSELEDRAGSDVGVDEELSELEVDEEDEEEHEEPEDDENEDEVHDGEDTEAETERLHESPDKPRISRNVHHRAEDQLQLPDDNIDQTSEISALSESEAGDLSRLDSPVSSPRKRKREELESGDEGEDETDQTLRDVSRKLSKQAAEDEEDVDTKGDADDHEGDEDKDAEEEDEGNEQASSKEVTPDRETSPKPAGKDTADLSEAEDAEADAEEGEGDAAAQGEDAGKKESALSSLRGVEKDFARLRDQLFVHRLQQLNDELELLQSNPAQHTEYAAAIEAIDRRREEQVRIARITLDYKVKSLQNKSVAERSMAHSQYMQEVRQVRDSCLEAAGEEWYRIQKARRQGDDDEFEKRYHFVPDRTRQVARQTAFNQEVSILSGIQKYVGFPAAPTIEGATPSEVEEDLKRMGIVSKQKLPVAAPLSSFPRQMQPTADEHFLKQNPWADPQNAYQAHAQIIPSAQQYATPAVVRQPAAPQNSASTIAASSIEQTPMSNQPGGPQRFAGQYEGPSETPSRINGGSPRSSPLKGVPGPAAVAVQAGSG